MPDDPNVQNAYVFKNGMRYPIKMRSISPEEVVRRRQDQAVAAGRIDPTTAPIYDPAAEAETDERSEPQPAPEPAPAPAPTPRRTRTTPEAG